MKTETLTYKVRGRWSFPLDMLARDDSQPATEADAALINKLSGEFCPDDINIRDSYVVTLQMSAGESGRLHPNIDRWNSFGWEVIEQDRIYTPVEKRVWLQRHGFKAGERNPRLNTNYPGAFMVVEEYDDDELPTEDGSNGPWCIVGDDLDGLIAEAFGVWHNDPVFPNIAKDAVEYIKEYLGLEFTVEQFTELCQEGGINSDINLGREFATGEREMFYDVLAKKFTPFDHWPSYGESFEGFEDKFIRELTENATAWANGKPFEKSVLPGTLPLDYHIYLRGEIIAAFPTLRAADEYARQRIVMLRELTEEYQVKRKNVLMVRYKQASIDGRARDGMIRIGGGEGAAIMSPQEFDKVCFSLEKLDADFRPKPGASGMMDPVFQ